jgi:hypothetical protein
MDDTDTFPLQPFITHASLLACGPPSTTHLIYNASHVHTAWHAPVLLHSDTECDRYTWARLGVAVLLMVTLIWALDAYRV